MLEPQLPEVLRALTGPADVVSVNNYDLGPLVAPLNALIPASLGALDYDPFVRLEQLAEITGKPLYISEWFYRLPRPEGVASHPFFLPEVPDGIAQAAAVDRYLDELDDMPFVVGEAWFQWVDQPLEGRASDGENQIHGIVDIDDRIRQPLFDTFAARNADLIERRLGATTVTTSFPTSVCDNLDHLAATSGLTRAEVVQFGVALLDLLAASSADPPAPIPVVAGPCEVTVTWDADDQVLLDRAVEAWGMAPGDLHNAGGRFLLAIVYWFAVNG